MNNDNLDLYVDLTSSYYISLYIHIGFVEHIIRH